MGGTIEAPKPERVICDLRNERDAFKRALQDIVDSRHGTKRRKEALKEARRLLGGAQSKPEESDFGWGGGIGEKPGFVKRPHCGPWRKKW